MSYVATVYENGTAGRWSTAPSVYDIVAVLGPYETQEEAETVGLEFARNYGGSMDDKMDGKTPSYYAQTHELLENK